jgi:hypothetical protein
MQLCPNCKSTRIGRFRLDSDWGGGSGDWSAKNRKDAGYTEQDIKSFEDNDRPDIECCVCCVCSTCFTPSYA